MTGAPHATAPETPDTRITADDIQTRLRIALRDIAAYWNKTLPIGIAPHTTGIIGRSPDRADPIRAGVLNVRLETLDTLRFYARVVLDERSGQYDMPGRLDGNDAVALARFLDPHVDWIANHELGEAAMDDFAEHSRKLYNLAHPNQRTDVTFVGPCECGERIHAPAGADLIQCRTCGRATRREDLHRAGEREAREHLATAAEIEATSPKIGGRPVTAKQIRQWSRVYEPGRSHINPNPLQSKGRVRAPNGRLADLWNIGDVWTRFDEEQNKRAQRTASR